MKLGRGAAYNLAALAGSQLLGALAGILVARRLGPEGVGALALVFGLFAVLHPLAAFTASASVIQHARTGDMRRVFGTSLTLKLAVAASMLAVAFLASPWIARAIDVPPILVVVAGFGFVASTGYEVALNRLEAEGRLLARSLVLPFGPLVYLALVAFVVDDVVEAAAATVAGSVAMTLIALRHLGGVRPAFDRAIAAFMWRIGSRLVVGDLLFLGLVWFDTFTVSILLGKGEAGIYQTAYNVAFLLVVGATVLEITLVPLLARARARVAAPAVDNVTGLPAESRAAPPPGPAGTRADFADAYQLGSLLALGLAALAAVVLVPFGPLLLGLYGPAFVAAYPSLLLLLVMGAFGALFFPVKAVLAVLERPDLTVRITALQFVVNAPLNLVLIPRMGIAGAALASAVAFALGTVIGWVYVHRHAGVGPFPPPSRWWAAIKAGV